MTMVTTLTLTSTQLTAVRDLFFLLAAVGCALGLLGLVLLAQDAREAARRRSQVKRSDFRRAV